MAEMEVELNQTYEWKLLTEEGSKLERQYGSGYVGMRNLGNTCYIASVMQALYHIPDIPKKYITAFASLINTISPKSDDIHNNISFQLAKLFNGLSSGKYSTKEMAETFIEGISPASFKRCVGKDHREFSTGNQQDVHEFILHLFSLIEKHSRIFGDDFTRDFQFTVQEKIQCSVTKAVRYDIRKDNMLSLFVPMDKTINEREVKAFEELKEKYKEENKVPEVSEIVLPKVPFSELLTTFIETQIVENFKNPLLDDQRVEAHKSASIKKFPKYLFVHIKRFTITDDWRPAKLEVAVDMPDLIDLSVIRALPKPDNEILMPSGSSETAEPKFEFKDEFVNALMSMGFSQDACKRACFKTNNASLEAATNWLMENLDSPDLNSPFELPGSSSGANPPVENTPQVSEESVELIMAMGFERNPVMNALRKTDGVVERAIEYIFSHPDEDGGNDSAAAGGQAESQTNDQPTEADELDMGPAKYKLLSFISHIGPSALCGHYVAHVKINDQWVLFNDEKVAVSSKLPKDLGYIYVYERV